jgi:hypothetical protein
MARPAAGYKNAAGKRIPGTTTVIGRFKDSGALMHWAFSQGQNGAKTLYEKRDEAALAGTIAHDYIESFILQKDRPEFPSVAAETLVKADNAYLQFREWWDLTRMEIVATERSYVSELHQFGGTIDAVGRDAKGRIVLLDWKSSNGVYQDFLVQLGAYALLLQECAPAWTPEAFHLLRVAKESADFAHHFYGELEDAKAQFLLFRQAYDIDAKLKKRAA